jgi:hypothetical protein
MADHSKTLPVGFRIDISKESIRLSALKQSARGTRYLAQTAVISKEGKTKEQLTEEIEATWFKIAPNYPKEA